MDWPALWLSLQLSGLTVLLLLPAALFTARALAYRRFRGKSLIEALLAVPLVLPPTVVGFYLLVTLGPNGAVGQLMQSLGLGLLPFTFGGLVVGSVVYSLPLVV